MMLNLNAVMGVIADVPAVVVSFTLIIGITTVLIMPPHLDLHGTSCLLPLSLSDSLF